MTDLIRKLLALLLALGMAFAMSAAAFADDAAVIEDEAEKDGITVVPSNANALVLMDAGAQSPKGAPGQVMTVVLTMAVNREYLPSEKYMLRNITVQPDIPTDTSVSNWPFDIINASYVRHLDDMSYNSTADVYYKFSISEFAKEGVYPLNFTVNATVWREDSVNGTSITEDVKFNLCVWVTVIGDGELSGVTTAFGPLQLAGIDDTGGVIDSPVAQPGETITFKVPVVNKGGALTNITVEPVVSASLDEFPFIAQNASYGRSFSTWQTDGLATLEYSFTVSPYATTGNKCITFHATYYENGAAGECTFKAYIYIKNGYEKIATTAPSLMVTGYELMVDDAPVSGLMAGDDVLLRLKLTNNAAYDTTWKNVATLTIADSKVLTFTVGSSDSAYARAIKPGESADFDYHLTVRNDAEVGSTSVAITMTYETWDSVVGKATQTIMLPVSQPMDVVVDEPVVYGNAVSGKPIAVSLNIINMGRAKAMNLQVMATDGLTMAESYFGGDLLAGGSVAADVQVDAAKTGEFTGTLIVAYEDANGERYTQEIAVPMNVAESAPAAAVDLKQSDSDDSASSWPWWAWLLIVAVGVLVVGTAAALAVQIRRKKAGAGTAQAGGSDRPADGGGAGSDAR